MKIALLSMVLCAPAVHADTTSDCNKIENADEEDPYASFAATATTSIGGGIFDSAEFVDFIEPDAIGYFAGWCNADSDGRNLAIGYVCRDSDESFSLDCICGAVYLGTPCASCAICDSEGFLNQANFKADCSNVNSQNCAIECGDANNVDVSSNFATNTADSCPLTGSPDTPSTSTPSDGTPSTPTPTSVTPSPLTPSTPSPATSGAEKKMGSSGFIATITLLFWAS